MLSLSVIDELKSALAKYCQGRLPIDSRKNTGGLNPKPTHAIKELCVAYSGGLDSTVLLDVADKLCKAENIPLSACHINHGLSANAEYWSNHCQQECDARNIPFHAYSLNLNKQVQQSLEAQAREARYRALDDYASKTKLVLLAQHQNDQAETFLLQLKRGAGIEGLSAMPKFHINASGTAYLRPFLSLSRHDLENYAEQVGLSWIEDESNQDNHYDRNFLRNQIIPLLKARWPAIDKTISRSADNCAQAQQSNTEYMRLLADTLLCEEQKVSTVLLRTHSLATQRFFVRYWLDTYFSRKPSSAQLNDIIGLANSSTNSGYVELSGLAIERFKDKLHGLTFSYADLADEQLQTIAIDWNKASHINLHAELALQRVDVAADIDGDKVVSEVFSLPETGVECRFAASNMSFKSNPKRPTKKLKAWYQEWHISPLARLKTPVFVKNDHVLAVGVLPSIKTCQDVDKLNTNHKEALVKVTLVKRN